MHQIKVVTNKTIAIVGAGYCGTLCAINLIREGLQENDHILLIERNEIFGRGLAYRFFDDNLLLNVPAGNMSALANQPSHFVKYCQKIDPAFNEGSFVSRRIYGDYLEDLLTEYHGKHPNLLKKINQEVVAITRTELNQFDVTLETKQILRASHVILALGHDYSRKSHTNLAKNPWNFFLDYTPNQSHLPILILGTGHTAIDMAFRLISVNDKQKVILLSRHGLIPHSHRPVPKAPINSIYPEYLAKVKPVVLAYLRAIRKEVSNTNKTGGNWRDVMNQLRPHLNIIWSHLPERERKVFLRRLLPYWDVHRHRLAPVAKKRLEILMQNNQITVFSGRIVGYQIHTDNNTIKIKTKHADQARTLECKSLIDCTGPNYDIETIKQPLISSLYKSGLIQSDILRIGVEVDDLCQLIDCENKTIENMFYVGPMLRAKFWEATAVPELRVYSKKIANYIAAKK